MDNEEKYTTSDAFLAAYFIYNDLRLLTIELNNGWGSFVFSDSEKLQDLVGEYYAYKGSIPPRKMAVKYRNMLSILHETKEK